MLAVFAALVLAPILQVRIGKTDITPPELLPLGGYTERHGRVMDAGGDPLYSRVVVLSCGPLTVVIDSVETLTIPESLAAAVRAELPPGVHLLLCATHTHSAPDSQMLNSRMTMAIPGIANYRPRWLRWYGDKIAEGIRAALRSKPVASGTSLAALTWQSDVNRGRRNGAEPDKTATLVRLGHRPLFFHYAAHGTFFEEDRNTTSGDWPGGVGAVAPLVLIGPIGDVSPKAPRLDKAPGGAKIAAFWAQIVADKAKAKQSIVWRAGQPCEWLEPTVPLPTPRPNPDFEHEYRVKMAIGQLLVDKFAPISAHLSVLRIGRLVVVGIPGEPTSHLGREIVAAGRKLGFSNVLVVSHCNGWMGYLLDPRDYDAGGYEANLSFYGRDEGETVVRTAVEALRGLAAEAHRNQAESPHEARVLSRPGD